MTCCSVFASTPWNTLEEAQTPFWRQAIYSHLIFTVKILKTLVLKISHAQIISSMLYGGECWMHVYVWCMYVYRCVPIDGVVMVTHQGGFRGKNCLSRHAVYHRLCVEITWLSITVLTHITCLYIFPGWCQFCCLKVWIFFFIFQ